MGLVPLSVRTPLAHSASLALENWTGRNNNEAEKKGKEAERVKLACGARDNAPGCGVVGGTSPRRRAISNLATTENQRNLLAPQLRLKAKNLHTFFLRESGYPLQLFALANFFCKPNTVALPEVRDSNLHTV